MPKKNSKPEKVESTEKLKTSPKAKKEPPFDKHVRNGVLMLTDGLSLMPVRVTESTLTNKSGVQDGKDRGMAPQAHKVVEHAVYTVAFDINPNLANKTRTTNLDVLIALTLMPVAYASQASRCRNGANITIRSLWCFEHANKLFSAQPAELQALVMPKVKEGVTESRSWNDYINPTTADVEKAIQAYKGIKVLNLKERLLDQQENPKNIFGIEKLRNPLNKRYSGCMVIEVTRANINGDPDYGGAPREDCNGFGWFTGVSLARKLRDIVGNKEGTTWQYIRDYFTINNPDGFDILEERERDRTAIKALIQEDINKFLDKYWDARVFGNTFLDKEETPEVKDE